LLFICDAEAYRGTKTDVPGVYVRAVQDPRFEVWHGDAASVHASGTVRAMPVPANLHEAAFADVLGPGGSWTSVDDFDLVFDRTLKPFPPGFVEALTRTEDKT
jgi:hypothetical protein